MSFPFVETEYLMRFLRPYRTLMKNTPRVCFLSFSNVSKLSMTSIELSDDNIGTFFRVLLLYVSHSSLDQLRLQIHSILNFLEMNLSIQAKAPARVTSFYTLISLADRLRDEVPNIIRLVQQSLSFSPLVENAKEEDLPPTQSGFLFCFITFFFIETSIVRETITVC